MSPFSFSPSALFAVNSYRSKFFENIIFVIDFISGDMPSIENILIFNYNKMLDKISDEIVV
jgi:hypothetical protein